MRKRARERNASVGGGGIAGGGWEGREGREKKRDSICA